MIWSETCSRCGGDLSFDSSECGHFVNCARCGSVLTGPQERVLLDLAPALAGGRRTSGRLAAAGTHALPSSAFRLTHRLTRDDLLQLAIRLVREAGGDAPDFVGEVATVFEALKRDVESLTYLIESHRRLDWVAGSFARDGGTISRDTCAAALSPWEPEAALSEGF
jgi:hypothetical protein